MKLVSQRKSLLTDSSLILGVYFNGLLLLASELIRWLVCGKTQVLLKILGNVGNDKFSKERGVRLNVFFGKAARLLEAILS